ncbi:MAG TPA: PQQ-binding-like beta-propeller repeat protein [Bacteroidales bacterium]|nr:PQQ-binding-like beta-propeller repeat protein [Bacteroidales bacterium]
MLSPLIRVRITLTAILLIGSVYQAQPQVQAQWRGNDRRGVYPEQQTLEVWPATGPELLWSSSEIGSGYGSPVCLDGKLYICCALGENAWLFEFDRQGKLLRKVSFGKEWVVNYPGSRMSPTIAGGLIYVSTGQGDLVCIDLDTFKEKWRLDNRPGSQIMPLYGHSESPAVDGDLVFFTPGGKDTGVVALNRFTGKHVWGCPGDGERQGYNSPLIIRLPSRTILVTFSAYSLLGIDAKTGKLLWTHPQDNIPPAERKLGNGDTHSNTIWYENGAIFYLAGDGNGAVRLILGPDGASIRQVWRNPTVDNYMSGFIKQGNLIYTGSDSRKALISVDITTGEVKSVLKCGIGALISDGRMLYYYTHRGEVNLIRPSSTGPELVSIFKVTMGKQEHFAHPVIDRGILYIRHGNTLMAYQIRQ